jgi:glycosyltransferase involved in cell wall biosynthesis
MVKARLSVLVPCFNNEDILETCLRSCIWADEIVICDSFSMDGTLSIAQRYAHRILQHPYRNSASQKNWAIPQVTHEWVLIVDTDEQITPQLRHEIESVLEDPGDIAGFQIPRANHLFGYRLRHGSDWPDYQIRFFRRDAGRYEDREVHAHVLLEGPTGTLRNPLLHFPHRSLRDLRRVILQRYTTWEALERHKRGKRFHWYHLAVRPPAAFTYRFVVKQGWRDGWPGLFMATVWSCYVLITYLKMRALEHEKR